MIPDQAKRIAAEVASKSGFDFVALYYSTTFNEWFACASFLTRGDAVDFKTHCAKNAVLVSKDGEVL